MLLYIAYFYERILSHLFIHIHIIHLHTHHTSI